MIWHKTKFGEVIDFTKVEAVGVYKQPGKVNDVYPYKVLARTATNAYKLDECKTKEEAQKIAEAYVPNILKSIQMQQGSQILMPGQIPGMTH